jgi:hypothetical protein
MAKENDAQEQLTSRQRLNERYRSRNPELNVDDDEALGGAILSDLDAYDQDRERMDRFNKTVQDSEIAPELMAGLMSGKNPDGTDFSLEDYILDGHIDYILDYIDNKDTAKEKLAKRREERKKEAESANADGLSEEALAALQAEDAELDAALQETGYKPEQVKDLIDWLYNPETGVAKRIANYELKKDDFLRLLQIKDFDTRMKDAEEKGYKRGKNEKIDMFARQQKKRDEMPSDIDGGGGKQDIRTVDENPTVSALKKMSKY